MMRLISCFVFILTNSVLAQASTLPANGTIHVDTQKWVATHTGEAEVYGLSVTAVLEESKLGLQIPDVMAGGNETLVPSVMPVIKHNYRIKFLVSHNPRIESSFELQPRNISMDGKIRFAYVSDLDQKQDFHFVVTAEQDGAYHVTYIRNTPSEGGEDKGEFTLMPIPHTL